MTVAVDILRYVLMGAGGILFIQAFTPFFTPNGMDLDRQGGNMVLFVIGGAAGLLAYCYRRSIQRSDQSD